MTKVDARRVPASCYLGVVGMPGLTAWFGLHVRKIYLKLDAHSLEGLRDRLLQS